MTLIGSIAVWLPAPAIAAYSDEVLADAPGSYWRLNETAGTTAVDARGVRDGTYTGGVTLGQPGPTADTGTAASFDGVNDYVAVGDVYDFSSTAAFSVEGWVNRGSGNESVWRWIAAKESSGVREGWALGIGPTSSTGPNRIVLERYRGGVADRVWSTTTLAPATWYHVVGTYGGGTLNLYLNGNLEASVPSTRALLNTTAPLQLGHNNADTGFLGGRLDEVAVYPSALSSARVRAHYESAVGGNVSFVKAVGVDHCSGPTSVITVPAGGIPAGNTVLVRVSARDAPPAGGTISATDSSGNAYTKDADVAGGGGNNTRVAILSGYISTALSGGATITVSHPDTSSESVVIAEFSGIAATNRVDDVATTTGTSSTPSATVVTSSPRNLLFGGVARRVSGGFTEAPGWTTHADAEVNCGGPARTHHAHSGHRFVTSTGSYTYNPTMSGSVEWSEALVAYRAADTNPPAAPGITSTPASPGNDPTPTWGFSGEVGASFRCELLRGATVVSALGACTTPRTYDLTGQVDGTYTFRVQQFDAAGNPGPFANSTYVLDRAAPPPPAITTDPGSAGNDASPTWAFSSEAGATTRCELRRGGTVVSPYSSCTGSMTYDLGGQPDGDYTFSVRATDGAGNMGLPATHTYGLDRVGPVVTITTSPADPSDDDLPEWGFSMEPGAVAECRLTRGGAVISPFGPCTAPADYDLSAEGDGTYTFSVRATDGVGNTGPTESSSYLLDRIPTVTIVSAPGAVGSDATPEWAFSTDDPAASTTCQLTRGTDVVAPAAPCTSPTTFDLSAEPDATYTFSVTVTDATGNMGADTDAYTLDRDGASVDILTGPADPSADDSPTWTFSSEPGATTECRLNGPNGPVSGWAGCGSPVTFDLSAEPDGAYTIEVRATDGLGNMGAPASDTYVLDTTAPSTPTITAGPASPHADPTVDWSFVLGDPGATAECELTRGPDVIAPFGPCDSPAAFDLSSRPDGDYTFRVRGVDAAGNRGSAAEDTYTLDTTPPGAPSITSAPQSPDNDTTPSWGFTGAGVAFECELVLGPDVVEPFGPCTSPAAFDLGGEPDGTYTFRVRSVDGAGNTGPAATDDYDLDTTGPGVSFTAGPADPSADASPSWSFTTEAGATTECRLVRGGDEVSPAAPCSSPAAFDLTDEADGDYTLTVVATDPVGNAGPAATASYTLDRTPPAAPTLGSVPPTPGNDPTPRWTFSAEAGAQLECELSRDGTILQAFAPCNGEAQYDLAGEPDGDYVFRVQARDAAGNVGVPTTSTYTFDTTDPGVPIIDARPASPGTSTAPAWSFSTEPGTTAECRLSGVSGFAPCASPATFDLDGQPDGTFTFFVRAVDAAGNRSGEASDTYELDTTAPDVAFTSSPSSPGNGRNPSWSFTAEGGATTECELTGPGGPLVPYEDCSSPASYDLGGGAEGGYTLNVRATDEAGNVGSPASDTYVLDTEGPSVTITSGPASPSSDATPTWGFGTEAGASTVCELSSGGGAVSGPGPCGSPVTYDLGGRPDGSYTLIVRATDPAGNTGPAASASFTLDTSGPAVNITSGPSGPGSGTAVSWGFNTESGATTECQLAGPGFGSGPGPCTSPAGYDISGGQDGTYTFAVQASDEAGNGGTPASAFYVLDRQPPAAPTIVSEPVSPGSGSSPSWSFTAEAGSSTECALSGVSGYVPCAGSAAFDLSGDGTYTFSVRAIDAAGNTGPSATGEYVLDTTGPGVDIVESPGSPGNDRSPQWRFDTESGASTECRLLDEGGPAPSWSACSSPASFDLGGASDGAFTLEVRATDGLGNVGPSASSAYVMDTSSPVATITSAPPTPTNGSQASWSFLSEAGATFECELALDGVVIGPFAPCASPEVRDLSADGDGVYTFSVRATDAAGNTGPEDLASHVLDTQAPAAPVITSSPPTPANDRSPEWAFTSEAGASTECEMVHGSAVTPFVSCSSPHSADLGASPDGSHTLRVRAVDTAGNASPVVSSTYRLDTAAPVITFLSSPGSPGNSRTPSWTFEVEGGAPAECETSSDTGVISGFAPCSGSMDLDLSGRPDGTYIARVRATDQAGNEGSATSVYELDTAGPVVTITSGPAPTTTDRSPRWRFSVEEGATTRCQLLRGGTVVAPLKVCRSPVHFDLADEPSGTYTLRARATDDAGNQGPVATSSFVLEDATDGGVGGGDETPPPGGGSEEPVVETGPIAEVTEPIAPDRSRDRDRDRDRPTGAEEDPQPEPEASTASQVAPAPEGDGGRSGLDRFLQAARTVIASVLSQPGFPLSLLLLVILFLLVQNRIDRRDPKLALAPVYPDPHLDFEPVRPRGLHPAVAGAEDILDDP